MFRNVSGCSGMFHVPGFIDALFQVPDVLTEFCSESLVWVSERRLMVRVSGLKRVLSKAYIGLGWPVVLRCYYRLVDHG